MVVAALYTNRDMAIQVLRDLAPDHPNPLDYVTEQLTAMSTKFEGVHNRRMAILGWCTLLELPVNIRPSLVTYDPKKVGSILTLLLLLKYPTWFRVTET